MKCLLITGATGVIGSSLAPLFLDEPDTKLRLIVRAESEEHLLQRRNELFAFWERNPADRRLIGQVEFLRGDVTQRRLGLDPAGYQRMTHEVTHVVHAAGNVKLNRTLAEARRDAVVPLQEVLSFCRSCRGFRKLDHVSTVGVAGRLRGLIPEAPLDQPRAFRNTYEQAKAEAERVLLQEMAAGLPATIHRPSMIVGAARTGRIRHFQVFYHLSEFLTGARSAGFVPATADLRLDIVPVDYVVRAIQLAVNSPTTSGRILHLCSGPEQTPRLTDLARRLRSLEAARGRTVPRLRQVHPLWLRTIIPWLGLLGAGKTGRALRSLPHFLAYLEDPQVFATAASRAFLASEGLYLPAVDDYLKPVMTNYWTVCRDVC